MNDSIISILTSLLGGTSGSSYQADGEGAGCSDGANAGSGAENGGTDIFSLLLPLFFSVMSRQSEDDGDGDGSDTEGVDADGGTLQPFKRGEDFQRGERPQYLFPISDIASPSVIASLTRYFKDCLSFEASEAKTQIN